MIAHTGRVVTPKQLRAFEKGGVPKGYEFIDGVLRRKPPMGTESSRLALQLAVRLDAHCTAAGRGVVLGADGGYRCFRHNPTRVRKPDVSVIDADPETFIPPQGDYPTPPILAVEVVSPRETVNDLLAKIDDFRRAGTPLFWVISPVLREITVHRRDGTVSVLREPDALSGEDVLPGFAVPLADIFPRRPAAPTTTPEVTP